MFYTSKSIAYYDSMPKEKDFDIDEACSVFFNKIVKSNEVYYG